MLLPLHQAARDEAEGKDVSLRVAQLLDRGQDPHKTDDKGETAFNIAAPASPVCGRLMTNHWLKLALAGQGPKGLNDPSGSHGSTLAQYIAKWSRDDEIQAQIAAGVAKGMKVDIPNSSGWTPLMAAAAMGRVKAVEAFAGHYSRDALLARTTEEYKTVYNGHAVSYASGLTAAEVSFTRLEQDEGASCVFQNNLAACAAGVLLRLSEGGAGDS